MGFGKRTALGAAVLTIGVMATAASAADLTDQELLGKHLFYDANLSTPPGQACAVCHGPHVGFTGPKEQINMHGAVYEGAVAERFGNRKPPSSAYAGDSPVLHYDPAGKTWVGGMFWDGRATGWTLDDPLAEQAQGPYLNPLEQNNASADQVCQKVARSDYAPLYAKVYGEPIDASKDTPKVYANLARAIAAYERSAEMSPFTSKYDFFLQGKAKFTEQEARGLALFNDTKKGNCATCHPAPLFTDYTYDNLGMPRNPENPFYTMPPRYNPQGRSWVDLGLGAFLAGTKQYADQAAVNDGKHKTPTLRNVDKRPRPNFVKAYGHNGYFKSLESIVHFYNTRDLPGQDWPPSEVPRNVNKTELGNLHLTSDEEAAIIVFLQTLSDGYAPPQAPSPATSPATRSARTSGR